MYSITGSISAKLSRTSSSLFWSRCVRYQSKAAASPNSVTPAMEQWSDVKSSHPNFLVLLRIGDFYEIFYDDAIAASKVLGIALTKRSKKSGVPMCGVPHHAIDAHLQKLIRGGYKVAIVDQVETPSEARMARRKVVKREITRLITPGTVVEEGILASAAHNYIAGLSLDRTNKNTAALSWLDVSTGHFFVESLPLDTLIDNLGRISPSEILIPKSLFESDFPTIVAVLHRERGKLTIAEDGLFSSFGMEEVPGRPVVHFADDQLFSECEMIVSKALAYYVVGNFRGSLPSLRELRRSESRRSTMVIDSNALRALEIFRSYVDGSTKDSLLNAIDETVTSAGSRLLAQYLSAPIVNVLSINDRLDVVSYFFDHESAHIQRELRSCDDIERALQRIVLRRGSGRDMMSIGNSLTAVRKCVDALRTLSNRSANGRLPSLLEGVEKMMLSDSLDHLNRTLAAALVEDSTIATAASGIIRPGFSAALDEQRKLALHPNQVIADMQIRYRKQTSIPKLRVKLSPMLGIYVEIANNQNRLLDGFPDFSLIQATGAVSRYQTRETAEVSARMKLAEEEVARIEKAILEDLRTAILNCSSALRACASAVAFLDVSCSLASVARSKQFVRPEILSQGGSPLLNVRGGRHIMVEKGMMSAFRSGNSSGRSAPSAMFVPNDCNLSEAKRVWLLTGPNMGGKSTFLRQNAIIAILAQIGSFVPADSATLTPFDKVFCRVGASDDLARDQSTFMREMVETANILKHATKQSLVIMDEIGRGTSNSDGLAIAQAVLEHLHNEIGCSTLFATHYHELCDLRNEMKQMYCCYTLAVEDAVNADGVHFLRRIVPGVSPRSYAIYIARLAGVPRSVEERAASLSAQSNSVNSIGSPS